MYMIIIVFHIQNVVFIITCCETTQENINLRADETDGADRSKSPPFVGPKEEKAEKDEGKKIGLDVVKLEQPDDEESIGDVVVTNILTLSYIFIMVIVQC